MRKILFLGAGLLLLAGCASNPYGPYGSTPAFGSSTTADTATGAALGAVAGAVIGNQTHSPLAGAAIGAGVGGLAGYAISKNQNGSPANCPSGYNCIPNTPPPSCPPGYTCTPGYGQ